MMENKIQILKTDKSIEIEIQVKMNVVIINVILLILIFASGLVPIVAIILTNEPIKVSIFITIGIFWAVGWYLLRLFLWNNFGKETIIIDEKKATIYNDYRLYKKKTGVISVNGMSIRVLGKGNFGEEQKERIGVLLLCSEEEVLETNIQLKLKDLNTIIKEFNKFIQDINYEK